jgi:voltage-gated potassium channel
VTGAPGWAQTVPQGGWTVKPRQVTVAAVRAALIVGGLSVVFAVAPLHRLADVPLPQLLSAGVVALGVVAAAQIRSVVVSPHPALRAIEALAVTGTLFLYLFASAYVILEQAQPDSFNVDGLTRIDSLYFTVTVFATVGFGDIAATSQTARVMVTVQMILDLLVLGLGLRAFVGAVQRGRERVSREVPSPTPDDPVDRP